MYFKELRTNLVPLLAACIGMAFGSALNHYTMSLFGPALIADFGWSRADFALVGSLPLINLLTLPFAGWFADRYGARIGASVGFTALVFGFLALASMNGSILVFFALVAVQHVFGALSATLVFLRIAVYRFDMARGVALSLVMTASPLGGAIAAPLIGSMIDNEGWRTGYLALAAICTAGGLISLILMGPQQREERNSAPDMRLTRKELQEFARNPLLLLILFGMFVVNIPQVFAASQMKLITMDSGVSSAAATWMISLYATGVIVGRLLSGVALDRVEPHVVAIGALGLPAIGYLVFAAPVTSIAALAAAIMVIGLAQGAEGDIGGYLISRKFGLKNFSLLLSVMTAMIGLGSATGSIILSVTLHLSGGYEPFLLISAVATLAGAACLAMTGSRRFGSSCEAERGASAAPAGAAAGDIAP